MRNFPLKILIDGGLLDKPRGLGRSLKELIFAFSVVQPTDIELIVLVHDDVAQEHLISARCIRYERLPKMPIPIWEQFLVPYAAFRHKVDLVHSPANTKPLALNYSKIPHIVTLHDLIFLHSSGATWYQRIGALYRRVVVKAMLKGRLNLVTVSRSSADDIKRLLGRESTVVPVSVELFLRQEPSQTAAAHSVAMPYFIHIGGVAPHKNTVRVIQAFAAANLPNYDLIVLGIPADSAFAQTHAGTHVKFPGWVTDAQIKTYISNANAMIFPSLVEGYGLPIAEALSLGCPVITSNFAPMSEVAGGAARLVDPLSVTEMQAAITEMALDASKREQLISAARIRAEAFSADNVGRRMLELYREAVA
jgi:glycosyltransferase involved in cell wall biosynthesis